MCSINNCLEILITDKQTGEEWHCNYDSVFIENLTHKTGNFKQFDIFVTMLKSGLLKTSSSINLDLLTFEDLEALRIKRLRSHLSCTHSSAYNSQNKRYLIVTYSVEFDRIHYPIPLEYCGPPDPKILQMTIQRLEEELENIKAERNQRGESQQIAALHKRIDELNEENFELQEEIRELKRSLQKTPKHEISLLQKAITNLEKSIMSERKTHHKLVEKLRHEKQHLKEELEKIKSNEKLLKCQLRALNPSPSRNSEITKIQIPRKSDSVHLLYQRSPSPQKRNLYVKQIKKKPDSSRLVKAECWSTANCNKNVRSKSSCSRIQLRSRSSSTSSSFRSQYSAARGSHTSSNSGVMEGEKSGKSTERSKINRSRSSSVSSADSQFKLRRTIKNKLVPRSISDMKQVQSHELDFKNLERRIQNLQKTLNENMKLH